MKCFSGVLGSPKLRKYVRTLSYNTVIDDLQGADCRVALESVDRFTNLENIHVRFSNSAYVEPSPIFSKSWLGYVLSGPDFQSALLLILFKRLYDPTCSTRPRLRSLSISNLTNVAHHILTGSPHVKFCLGQISSLRLKLLTTIKGYAAPLPELFTSLHRDWLGPSAEKLTSLTLYGNILWQYVPRTKFLTEATHFSSLKRLELGSFPITHEYQMDWILSHETLEELVLNDCQITHYMSFPKVRDSDGHMTPFLDTENTPVYKNKLRWLQVYQQIEIRLPRLMVFRFACGSAANFENGLILEKGLFPDRYVAFIRPWISWTRRDTIKDPQCNWPQDDSEFVIEEEKAYQHLTTVVKARREKWLMSRHV